MDSSILNSISLTGVAASLAKAMGIEPPAQAEASIPAIDRLVQTNTQAYVKPVIKIDTLFDALIRAGKKPAIH